jgi:integrase
VAYLVKRGKYFYVYYYDKNSQKLKGISTKETSSGAAKLILKNYQAKQTLKIDLPNQERKILLSEGLRMFLMDKINLNTITSYRIAVTKFQNVIGDKYLHQYTKENYLTYLQSLNQHYFTPKEKREKFLSRVTIQSYVRDLYIFFSWCVKQKFLSNNIVEKIKVKVRDVKPIPEEDLQKILSNLKERYLFHQYNFVKLAYLCAFRVSEVINCQREDFNFTDKIIEVRNQKGGRIDKIPMLKDIEDFLLSMDLPGKGKLFQYNDRHNATRSWETSNRISELHYTFHQLRKTRGTNLANAGVEPLFLQRFMRHKDFKTTLKYYIKIDMSRMRESINQKLL